MNKKTLIQTVGPKIANEMAEKHDKALKQIQTFTSDIEEYESCLLVAGKWVYSPLSDKFRTLGSRTWVGNGMAFMADNIK